MAPWVRAYVPEVLLPVKCRSVIAIVEGTALLVLPKGQQSTVRTCQFSHVALETHRTLEHLVADVAHVGLWLGRPFRGLLRVTPPVANHASLTACSVAAVRVLAL